MTILKEKKRLRHEELTEFSLQILILCGLQEHESNTVRDRTALDENYMVEFYGRYGIPAEKLKSCLKVLAFMKDEIDSDDRQHVHRRKAIVRFLDLCHDSSHSHSVARSVNQ